MTRPTRSHDWAVRIAVAADIPAIAPMMARSIRALLRPYLPEASVQASFEIMGLDTQLIDDGTYFAIEEHARVIGCGGWSRRATLFGGNHTGGRSDALLNPAIDPARVRAMYTDPDHARRGVGRAILDACETAARAEGFRRLELAATLADLSRSTEEIRKLQSGLQIVCAWTKRIQVDGQWMPLDQFLSDKLHVSISHTISPDALQAIKKSLDKE